MKDLLGQDISLENYLLHSSEILKYVLLKRISPLYVYCSKWIQNLPNPIRSDILDLSNLDVLKDFDTSNIKNIYKKYFSHEI
jgi:hypothetical protein